jgi:hypothetical protein
MAGIFDLFDQMLAEELGVDVETYTTTIEKFNDTDMDFIILSMLENTSEDDKQKAIDLFKTKL